ncbi:MAG: helix-turn-helix transcriptional regulator [Gemmatimonadota bacterium]
MTGERITKAQRLLDLIACLLGRRTPMTVEQIFEAVPAYRRAAGADGAPDPASVRRMFERDKDELRGLGIPIDTKQFSVNYGLDTAEGYVLRSGALYLPYLEIVAASEGSTPPASGEPAAPVFTGEELEFALEALREAAEAPGWPLTAETRSAFRKLAFDLGSLPEPSPVLHTRPPGAEEVASILPVLTDAIVRRKRVAFRYHGLARGEATDRDVAPYGLLLQEGTSYLVGHDELRDGVRMFHVGRIESPQVNRSSPASPDFEVPADFALSGYGDREAWEIGGEEEEMSVWVRFTPPMALWAARNGFGEPVEETEDGGEIRRFDVRHERPFLCWILGLSGDARIVEPSGVAEELRRLAAEIGDAHG